MAKNVRAAGPWEYFVAKVAIGHPDSCWEWQGAKKNNGYGMWTLKRSQHQLAHRAAYELCKGSAKGHDVLHTCNNPMCCNPEHLYLGSDLENCRDRIGVGTQTNYSGLTTEQVKQIRSRASSGEKQATLAREHNVSRSTVSRIVSGKLYAWL